MGKTLNPSPYTPTPSTSRPSMAPSIKKMEDIPLVCHSAARGLGKFRFGGGHLAVLVVAFRRQGLWHFPSKAGHAVLYTQKRHPKPQIIPNTSSGSVPEDLPTRPRPPAFITPS